MKRLIATYPILYLATQYEIGDEIPANNPKMVDAWIKAGTAKWQEDEILDEGLEEGAEGTATMATPKDGVETLPSFATPVSNEVGLEGDAVNAETTENLVGRVPKTPVRSRK